MKKVIFLLTATIGGLCAFQASAQVAVCVKIGTPVYCPPPPPKVIVVKPAPVVVVPVRRQIVVQPPVYVVAKPTRKVVIYR